MEFGHADPLNHPDLESIRQRMLAGDRIASCLLCDSAAQDGASSAREGFNINYGRPDTPNLRYLELTFGNLCNLRCRMCNSGASTRWIADEIRMGKRPTPHRTWGVDDLRLEYGTIHRLRISGGEPLMEQDKITDVLGRIESARGGLSDVHFEMVSNGTIDIEPGMMAMLDRCRSVFLQTSMDGLREVNAYQRTGSDFDSLERRIRLYDSMAGEPGFTHAIACSLGVLNLDGFTDFVDWVSSELPNTNFILQPIYDPDWQAVHNLPEAVKDMYASLFSSWAPSDRLVQSGLDVTLRNMLRRPSLLDAGLILERIAEQDALTDESFARVQPRMHAALLGTLTY